MWNVRNLFFFHTLTETHFGEKNFFSPYKSIKLRKISRFFPNISKIFGLSGKGVPPPILKFFFFADLHYLGHERKKNKKVWKWPDFVLTPPPKCEISHFFFFFFERDLPLQQRMLHNKMLVVNGLMGKTSLNHSKPKSHFLLSVRYDKMKHWTWHC